MTKALRVVVLDDYQGVAERLADWAGAPVPLHVDFVREHLADEDELVARLADAEVVVAMRERTPLPARLTSRLSNLRLIITTGMRNASIEPVPGVLICGTDALVSPAAELTWTLILAHRRGLVHEAASLEAGHWQHGLGEGLEGSTLGLLGLGNIGRRVARVAQAFGMDVVAWSQNLTAAKAAEAGVAAVGFDDVFARADVVSVHLRLSDRTDRLVTAREFVLMKPGALFVNTSRAQIVDTTALAAALREKAIAGAALDVFDREPVKAGDPLLGLPGLLATPHLGYVVRQNYEIFFRQALEDIVAFAAGSPTRVIVE